MSQPPCFSIKKKSLVIGMCAGTDDNDAGKSQYECCGCLPNLGICTDRLSGPQQNSSGFVVNINDTITITKRKK